MEFDETARAYFQKEYEEQRAKEYGIAKAVLDMTPSDFDALRQRCTMGVPHPTAEDNEKYGRFLAELYK